MINYTRRTVLATLGILATPLANGWSFGSDELEIDLLVTDEQGKPIPYVTIWSSVLPSRSPLALDGNDLWRLTSRYQASFEFATRFGTPIVPKLHINPMGNVDGKAKLVINYRYLEGGSDTVRPPSMQIGLTVMQNGYFPARIDLTVTSESRLSSKIVLTRNPNQASETQPYLQEFNRIRYVLSDPSRNENISGVTQQRNESLRTMLEAAANEALVAGDKPAAARIYARMQYLPVVVMVNGKAVGFQQSDQYSTQSWAYLVKAYELDPSNSYIATKYLFRYGATEFGGEKYRPEQAAGERQRAFAAFLSQLHTLMRANGKEIWPNYHMLYALWHRKSSDSDERARMIPLLEDLYRFEPKYDSKENLMRSLS